MTSRKLFLLMLMVAVIIIVPAWFKAKLTDQVLDASELVSHTYSVEANANALAMNIRDREAAAMALVSGIDTPLVRSRISEGGDRVDAQFARLLEITRNAPEQQMRLGMLRATVNQRQAMFERIVNAGSREERKQLARRFLDELPVRDQVNALVDGQRALLEQRRAEAQRLEDTLLVVRWLAVALQLALLLLLIWMLYRNQQQHGRMQQSLSASNARAMAVLQTVRDPIVLLDDQQHILQHNQAFADIYGLVDDVLPGQALHAICDGAWQQEEIHTRLREVQAHGRELWDFEVDQSVADGSTRTMLLNARRMTLPDRKDNVTLLTISDASARKASEREIYELNRQLEGKVEQVSEVNRELEAFSYSVSHDLRAPLRHIAGFSDKLEGKLSADADEQTLHYLATIRNSAKRMAALIDDLLVYSRLGRSAMRLQAVDMQSVVEEIRAMLQSNALTESPERRIEWQIDHLPIVIGDENMLRQVWLNLLGNAVKYSAPKDPSRITVGYARLDDGSHEFHVTDNGVGFDMAYAGKLFGVFQRMHRASEFAGTGIGLASVRRVILRHNGDVQAHSELGKGTTLRFTLPAMLDSPDANKSSK